MPLRTVRHVPVVGTKEITKICMERERTLSTCGRGVKIAFETYKRVVADWYPGSGAENGRNIHLGWAASTTSAESLVMQSTSQESTRDAML
jgi:hypothetical protein